MKAILSNTIILICILLGNVNAQTPEYLQEIEQWDDSLYSVTISDLQGRCKTNSLLYGDPENLQFVLNETSPGVTDGDDFLEAKMWTPNNLRGVKPFDVCYNQSYNKIYVYGNTRLLIINSITKQLITTIEVSDVGEGSTQLEYVYPKSKCLEYDNVHDKLYCATLGKELVVIDGNTNEKITEFTMNDQLSQIAPIIKHNEAYNRIYWINNYWLTGSEVKVFNTETLGIVSEYYFANELINDLEINDDGSLCYAAIGDNLKFINPLDFSEVLSVPTGLLNELVYSSSSNKIYGGLLNSSQLVVLNGDNGTFYSPVNLPLPIVGSGCANNMDNKVYFTLRAPAATNNWRIIGLDCSDDSFVINSVLNGARSLLCNNNLPSKVYCGGNDKLLTYNGNTNMCIMASYIDGCQSNVLSLGYNDEIVSISNYDHTISYFDRLGVHYYTENTGGSVQFGCYNAQNDKVYFVKDNVSHKNSYIDIWDGELNNQIACLPIGPQLRSICYNSNSNKVFVSYFLDNNSGIKVIDGFTNDPLPDIEILNPFYLFSHLNNIYCCHQDGIKIINADTYQETLIDLPPSGRWSAAVDGNDRIWFADGQNSKVYIIGYCSNMLIFDFNTLGGANNIVFNPENNKMYVSNYNGISIYNADNYQFITSVQIQDFGPGLPMVYAQYSNKLYVYMEDNTDKKIIACIDGTSNLMTDFLLIENPVLGMYYNPSNNHLYVHFPYSTDHLKMVVKVYDCTDNKLIDIIETGNIQKPGLVMYYNLHRNTPYSNDFNKLFFGNLGFANVSAIKIADEKLQLNSGYRWISFPRMPRYAFDDDPFSSESVLSNISYYPNIEFKLLDQYNKKKEWINGSWTGLLDEVQSTLGYQLNISPIEGLPPTLSLKGARLDPNFPVSLPGENKTKWIGYFIKESQFPWQAFPTDVYNNKLQSIKAQYWSMYKDETKGWTVTGKVTPIKYGDMLSVRTNQPGPINFQWNNPDESVADVEVPNPAAFSWEEQADYTPFFIETDAYTDIEEIAVIVDGECMGATVVQPGDTLVEVDGYFGDIPAGSTVEFETWNGFKSSPVEKGQYIVYNPLNGRKEKRNIYTGERRDYYLLSFKQGETGEIPADICDVSCQPNPFDRLTTLSMRLNRDQKITVNVFDINGVKIKTLINRNMTGGYYEIPWAGDNETGGTIKKGVYFFKITSAEGSEITGKIVKID